MRSKSRLKIAYLCDLSPHLGWTYSGGNARIFDAVQSHVGDVEFIDNGWGRVEALRRLILKTPVAINMRSRWRAHYALSKIIAKHVETQLQQKPYDVLLGAYSLHAMANLNVPKGVIRAFTSDATQSSYRGSEVGAGFGSYFKPGRLLDNWAKRQETRALVANDINLWPSDWQKDLADRCYGLEDEKSIVIPWGANIPRPDAKGLRPNLALSPKVQLLLVGRDWHAKGGPMALETLSKLRVKGIDVRLTVVGTRPPASALDAFVDVYENLDKSVPEQLAQFETLFRESHFLVQPSLESYGFAFCEASAYGLPSLCLRRGGIPIWDGVNGHAVTGTDAATQFFNLIQHYIAAPEDYKALRLSSRRCYEKQLNWTAWGKATQACLQELCDRKAIALAS
ncbi:MAG: glycosyltransferase family 4 protein [Cognatishimia sp.]